MFWLLSNHYLCIFVVNIKQCIYYFNDDTNVFPLLSLNYLNCVKSSFTIYKDIALLIFFVFCIRGLVNIDLSCILFDFCNYRNFLEESKGNVVK